MSGRMTKLLICGCLLIGLQVAVAGQSSEDTAAAHRAAAKAAAGNDLMGLYHTVCPEPGSAVVQPPRVPAGQGAESAPAQRSAPSRDQWYNEPVKVFDNLYFVGTKVHGSWAVSTSDGIILVDTLYSYAVEDAIVGGLKKLGLDPAQIKYVVVSHGHGDHHGGAKYLQDRFGSRIIMGAPDWDLVERNPRDPKPRRDMVAADGQKLTLGGETLTLYLTPGHTMGTISTLVPVKDGGKAHLAAEWGGTAFNPGTTIEQLKAYVASAERFRKIVEQAGADVIITNHTQFDDTLSKLEALGRRKPGDQNPFVVGNDAVKRYLTVAEECGKAALAESEAKNRH